MGFVGNVGNTPCYDKWGLCSNWTEIPVTQPIIYQKSLIHHKKLPLLMKQLFGLMRTHKRGDFWGNYGQL